MLQKHMLYVTGLPRAGATLLCQLLNHHPDIDSSGAHSPLCSALVSLRQHLSQHNGLLTQLDSNFDPTYQQLVRAYQGLVNGWVAGSDTPWVVDRSQDWLSQIELVQLLDPEFRMVVCLRELGQIYGSIETHHHATQLIDFPDALAGLSRSERAMKLFERDGIVGAPLNALDAVQDVDQTFQSRFYYVIFEHLISDPLAVMADMYQWLNLPAAPFDPKNLTVTPSPSHHSHHFKYPQSTDAQINPLPHHKVPQRFNIALKENFSWYYSIFYPGLI
ncbi:MAG: sulfotransferase [Cyanobacteria bacterium P01_H01_bin.152]